jgi:hypothetical protein
MTCDVKAFEFYFGTKITWLNQKSIKLTNLEKKIELRQKVIRYTPYCVEYFRGLHDMDFFYSSATHGFVS